MENTAIDRNPVVVRQLLRFYQRVRASNMKICTCSRAGARLTRICTERSNLLTIVIKALYSEIICRTIPQWRRP